MISVIMPVKNTEESLLRRAISSVQNQTFQDFEILLIDDGSEASFAKIMDRIAETDPRIRCFHITSSGVSGARNFAMQRAQGDVVTFLDGDDALGPCCLEEAALLLEDPSVDALWGGTCYVSEAEMKSLLENSAHQKPRRKEDLESQRILLTRERIHQTRAECIGEPFRFHDPAFPEGYINRGIAARFLRSRLLKDERYLFPLSIKMYEDTIWNLEMMNGLRISYVPSVWYYYYNNESSVSNRYQEDILERLQVPLLRIRKMLDLSNETEYAAYTRFLMDSLRYVCKCLYGHPDWNPGKGERKNIRRIIYQKQPWKEIGSSRFLRSAGKRDQQKAFLYHLHLLLPYWKRTWKKM